MGVIKFHTQMLHMLSTVLKTQELCVKINRKLNIKITKLFMSIVSQQNRDIQANNDVLEWEIICYSNTEMFLVKNITNKLILFLKVTYRNVLNAILIHLRHLLPSALKRLTSGRRVKNTETFN